MLFEAIGVHVHSDGGEASEQVCCEEERSPAPGGASFQSSDDVRVCEGENMIADSWIPHYFIKMDGWALFVWLVVVGMIIIGWVVCMIVDAREDRERKK